MITGQPFRDRVTYVVAGGPSVQLPHIRTIGMARARDECRIIAVNDAAYPCWFADHLHACDRRWWVEHNGVPGFAGVKTALEATPFQDVLTFVNSGEEGFDSSPGHLRTGSNSGYQAVHLAASLGASTIILLGVDYSDNGAREHWFGLHQPGMDKHSDVDQWRRRLRLLTDELSLRGITVMNAGRHSTLSWLPQVDLGSS
jgi:hypothetical protein